MVLSNPKLIVSYKLNEKVEVDIMFKLKLGKAFIVGLCMSFLTTGVVFAKDVVVNTLAVDETVVEEEMLDKQAEVDQYLFEDHKDEIAEKGIAVTHTAPMDGYVEVGINPFKDEYADYLYEVLGKDTIKVVEGTDMSAWGAVAEPVMSITDTKTQNEITPMMIIGIVGGIVLLTGITVIVIRKKRMS